MSALIHNITIEQGATFQRCFTCVDANGAEFIPETVKADLRDEHGAVVDHFEASTTDNKIYIQLAADVTAALSPAIAYSYDVKATQADIAYRIAQGGATVSEQKTK